MRVFQRFTFTIAVAAVFSVAGAASAQNTMTGQLVEDLPGGGNVTFPYIRVNSVLSDGFGSVVTTLFGCDNTYTTDCVAADGSFNATNLPNGLYILYISSDSHMDKVINLAVNGDTNAGAVSLIRKPFLVQVTMGDIPAKGGSIPLAAQVQTQWSIPPIPVIVRQQLLQDTANGWGSYREVGSPISLTWPTTLTDTGTVPLAPFEVQASTPGGAYSCYEVKIELAGRPDLVLGSGGRCRGKHP